MCVCWEGGEGDEVRGLCVDVSVGRQGDLALTESTSSQATPLAKRLI